MTAAKCRPARGPGSAVGASVAAAVATVSVLVRDYDEARDWYIDKLGFTLIDDREMGGGKRWVVVAPPGGGGARLLLAAAVKPAEIAQVGNQAGG